IRRQNNTLVAELGFETIAYGSIPDYGQPQHFEAAAKKLNDAVAAHIEKMRQQYAPSRAQSGPVSEPAAQGSAPVEPNLEAARALLDEQRRATGNPKAEAAVRKKARDL